MLLEDADILLDFTAFLRMSLLDNDVPEVIYTDKFWSYGAFIRAIPVLHTVEHLQFISTATARCKI